MATLPRNGFVQPIEGITGGIPIPVIADPNRVTFAVNQKNVLVPGTAVALQPQAVPDDFSIYLRAKVSNTGTIWVGPDAATAQNHAVATPLEPGAFLFLWLTNTSAIFIDAEVAGEGVSWTVEI